VAMWTTADIPDQRGRVAVITGSNTGLGYETAAALATRGAHVVLAVRNLEKGKRAAAAITATHPAASVGIQELDLTSLESIHTAAEQLRSDYRVVDILVNNAGVMITPKSTTKDGFELQFGTNHLGHFAFTGLLLDRMLAERGSRVVTVSSLAHRHRAAIHFDDLQWQRSYSRTGAYGQSKLANVLFTYELQRRLLGRNTIAVAAHPGLSRTELARDIPRSLSALRPIVQAFFPDAAQGALPTLRAATDPGVLGGQFVGPGGFYEMGGYPKIVLSSRQSYDVGLQRRLWAISEELTGVKYPVA
jgi:NAD(P)-dependent dehydrogenase (short-subunit alcohol dehydrogenase family)